jgi:hypothetical protein
MFSSSRSPLFWPVGWMDGWMGVCTTGDHEKKKRWSSPGSRRDIPQAPGHPRILLPLCVLPNSPASGLASSHSGVARDDSHRTVSCFHSPFPWISSSSSLALVEAPLFPSPPPLTFTLLVITILPPRRATARRAHESGIESPSRSGSNSTCQRSSSPSRKYSKARRGKGVGRSLRKRDGSRVVVRRLRLSATAPCSEMRANAPENPFRIWIWLARGRCEAGSHS